MSPTAEQVAEQAVKDPRELIATQIAQITDVEQEFRTYLSAREQAPQGVEALRQLAAKTSTKLLELDQDGIALELTETTRSESADYLLRALRTLHRLEMGQGAEEPADQLHSALLDLEAVRHVLRDAIDHEPLRTLGEGLAAKMSRADAAREVASWLPRLPRDQQAELLGIATKTLGRWQHDADHIAPWRAEVVVRLVGILRHSWTDEGTFRWFSRPHPSLGNQTPTQVLESDDPLVAEQRLLATAQAGRAQTAT